MRQPDIVFIFSDQHNPQYIGHNPGSILRTPNLDRLIDEGVYMTNNYCPSPVCVPSRACMLTSTYPQDLGVILNDHSMPSDWPTVAHSLGASGYETVLCGRMHFIGADQRHGFEKRLVGDFTWQYPGGREKNHNMRWDDKADMTYGPNYKSVKQSGGGQSGGMVYDDTVRDSAIRFIEQRTDDRPLFLTVGFYSPHNPFVGPKEYFDYYYENLEIEEITEEYIASLHPTTRTQMNLMGLDDVTPEDIRRARAGYCALVQKMDDDIGMILEAVEKNMDMDNTIIVYASDHGEFAGARGLFYKFAMYDGSASVPMIMKWQNHFKAGFEMHNITSIIDIPPTLIEAAGAAQLPLTRGISLYQNLIDGTDVDPDRTTCSMIAWNKLIFGGKQYQIKNVKTNYTSSKSFGADEPKHALLAMIRSHEYKLVLHGFAEDKDYELYNLEEDPGEIHDISKLPENAELCDALAKELLKVWDPKAMLEKIIRDKAGFDIMQKWFEVHDRSLDEEVWIPGMCKQPVNYWGK